MAASRYSFVIPAYNDAKGLMAHFEYFFARPEQIQLVIVDDCSTDDTQDVVAAAKPPQNIIVTYVRQARNLGPSAARNAGILLTDADYVMFIDADDLLTDYFFDYIELSPLMNGADVVLFKYHLTPDISDRFTYQMHKVDRTFFSSLGYSGFPLGTFTVSDLPGALSIVNFPWNKIYRRAFLFEQNIQFPDHRMNEDILPHWQSLIRAKKFGVLAWAPPLITHVESLGGSRATNYVGPLRLQVFAKLRELHAELLAHEESDLLIKELRGFFEGLGTWMVDVLCAGHDPERLAWRVRYKAEIKAFRKFLKKGERLSSADGATSPDPALQGVT